MFLQNTDLALAMVIWKYVFLKELTLYMPKVVIIQVSNMSLRKAVSWPDVCRLGCEGNNSLFEKGFWQERKNFNNIK